MSIPRFRAEVERGKVESDVGERKWRGKWERGSGDGEGEVGK